MGPIFKATLRGGFRLGGRNDGTRKRPEWWDEEGAGMTRRGRSRNDEKGKG